MNDNVLDAAREFMVAFEEVFDRDWAYTKEMLGIRDATPEQEEACLKMGLQSISIIASDGTFLDPRVDETEDWGNRGALLEKYRALKRLLPE